MRVIEITEPTEAFAEYANSQEPILLTRNGQVIAALMPLEANRNIDNIPPQLMEMIEANQSRKKAELEPTFNQLVEQWRRETRGVSSTEQLSIMLITELLPQLRELSRADQLRVMQFLVSELAKEEGLTSVSEVETCVERLHNSHTAAHQLTQFLEEQKQIQNV